MTDSKYTDVVISPTSRCPISCDLFTFNRLTSQQLAVVLQPWHVYIMEIFHVLRFHFQFWIPVENLNHRDTELEHGGSIEKSYRNSDNLALSHLSFVADSSCLTRCSTMAIIVFEIDKTCSTLCWFSQCSFWKIKHDFKHENRHRGTSQ